MFLQGRLPGPVGVLPLPKGLNCNASNSLRRKVTTCAVKARWCLDIKYGKKLEAVALLQEWVENIGSVAGLTDKNTAINSGSIGSPESRLELEVEFATLSELETFWASIPPDAHRGWSQNLQPIIVHGSPTWEVYRTVEAFPSRERQNASGDVQVTPGSASLLMASSEDIEKFSQGAAPPMPASMQSTASGLSIVENTDDVDVVLDWKGDPMKINPGDKLPFKF